MPLCLFKVWYSHQSLHVPRKPKRAAGLNCLIPVSFFFFFRFFLRITEDGEHQPRQHAPLLIWEGKKRMLLISVFKRTMKGH